MVRRCPIHRERIVAFVAVMEVRQEDLCASVGLLDQLLVEVADLVASRNVSTTERPDTALERLMGYLNSFFSGPLGVRCSQHRATVQQDEQGEVNGEPGLALLLLDQVSQQPKNLLLGGLKDSSRHDDLHLGRKHRWGEDFPIVRAVWVALMRHHPECLFATTVLGSTLHSRGAP